MTSPIWITKAGTVGSSECGRDIDTITLLANPGNTGSSITYSLFSGSYPAGLSVALPTISGTPAYVSANTTSIFTIRATDSVTGEFTNRTFSFTVTTSELEWDNPDSGAIFRVAATTTATGNDGDSDITVASVTSIEVGMAVSGIGIDENTIVTAINGSVITISSYLSSATSGVYTFSTTKFKEGQSLSISFLASKFGSTGVVKYKILNGNLPNGLTTASLNETTGVLSGTPSAVNSNTTSEFTIRATETLGSVVTEIADRTFNITVDGATPPTWSSTPWSGTPTPIGTAASTNDSTWVSLQLSATSSDPDTTVVYSIGTGSLPAGLEMNSTGLIRGYATPPTTSSAISSFTVIATSASGSAPQSFSITVLNQQLNYVGIFPGRAPAILNDQPLTFVISATDPYYSYYTDGTSIGKFDQATDFIFKAIGYNFDAPEDESPYEFDLTYEITNSTPAGAFASIVTPVSPAIGTFGWINAILATIGASINSYSFSVTVSRTSKPLIPSVTKTFNFVIVGTISDEIIWGTPSILESIDNGQISDLAVSATFGTGVTDGSYRLSSGAGDTSPPLPPGLQILNNGSISGRVEFKLASTNPYKFTVEAYSPLYPTLITSKKQFTITVNQVYDEPYDNIYIKGLLTRPDRLKISNLLNNITSTQSANIYRPTDPYFGVAKDVVYQHQYGVPSVSAEFIPTYNNNTIVVPLGSTVITLNVVSGIEIGQILQSVSFLQPNTFITAVDTITKSVTIDKPTILQAPINTVFTTNAPGNPNYFYDQYEAALRQSFYWRYITLGPLTTAVAKDNAGNIIYEVVYSQIIDNLVSDTGTSIARKIGFPNAVISVTGPYWTSWESIYTSNTYYDLAPLAKALVTAASATTTISLNNVTDLVVGMQVTGFPGVTIAPDISGGVPGIPPIITAINTSLNTISLNVPQTIVNKAQLIFNEPIVTSNTDTTDGSVELYPNSLPNMREEIAEMIGQLPTANLLPTWMTSQQANGSVLGYVPAWVLCYTKPGSSAAVLASINTYLSTRVPTPLTLNQIGFELDRIEIDRSMSYTWGTTAFDSWPPATPSVSVDNDSQNSFINFPRKTIL